jgi:hypothetical protein
VLLPILFSLTACAGNRAAGNTDSKTDYVEITNPAYTMSRDAPATIWVPRSSVDNGPLRGSEVVKKAYESVTSAPSPQSSTPVAAASTAAAVVAQSVSTAMRGRAAVLESGSGQLAGPFREKLRSLANAPVVAIAPEAAADKLLSRDARAAYAAKAWQDSGVNVSLFVLAADGFAAGRYLSVEIYDGMGAGLVSTVEAVIPNYDAKDSVAMNSAVASSLALLADRTRDAIVQLPWYAKIVAVETGRIYINAGREAGINLGQKLVVLRGGKVVQGLGFAPGTAVGTVEVSGFVGSNGAIATVKDGMQVYLSDLVAAQ